MIEISVDPQFEVPVTISNELQNYTIDDKISGQMVYEVVGKSENTVRIRVKSLSIKPKKRITNV